MTWLQTTCQKFLQKTRHAVGKRSTVSLQVDHKFSKPNDKLPCYSIHGNTSCCWCITKVPMHKSFEEQSLMKALCFTFPLNLSSGILIFGQLGKLPFARLALVLSKELFHS